MTIFVSCLAGNLCLSSDSVMLITLAYLYIYLLRWVRRRSDAMKRLQLIDAIRKSLRCSSIQLQKTNIPCMLSSGTNTSLTHGPTDWCSNLQTLVGKDLVNVEVMLEKSNFRICAIEPKVTRMIWAFMHYIWDQICLKSLHIAIVHDVILKILIFKILSLFIYNFNVYHWCLK